jgi:D-alanyl-D-alanine endopeptidase (penicillin-binding protein 7)
MHAAVAALVALGLAGIPDLERDGRPHLRSESVLVRLVDGGEVLLEKRARDPRPIASITKLASMAVFLESAAELDPWVEITEDDKDRLKWSRSRLRVGQRYSPEDLFTAALVASDNRAVYALVRASGWARPLFVERMNAFAARLGMRDTRFVDPAGVDPGNVSTAWDLVLLLDAATRLDRVTRVTRLAEHALVSEEGATLGIVNTNRLARSPRWQVVLGKTGYTAEAGRGLAVRVVEGGREVDMIFLGAREMASVFGDAARVRRWLPGRLAAAKGRAT